jgi:serine/threonine protein phosphatase PrpC
VNDLVYERPFDVNFSGSTFVSTLIIGNKIYCGNVGDSRALVVSFDEKEGEVCCTPVSRDHKPDDPSESVKILEAGGRIESFKDQNGEPVGPKRVWLKNEDIPGLAMSRSFGDAVSFLAGVTAEPEVKEFTLRAMDKMIVVASDGVWEFMTNERVKQYLTL